jgi:endogenous inhibitor of DNA gyrase (YacG/DUF329 family)
MNANDNKPPEERAKDRPKGVCPNCGKPRDARYDPFCSKRCADVDLHRWLKGGYVIPGAPAGREPGDEDH